MACVGCNGGGGKKLRKYNTFVQQYTAAQFVVADPLCNGFSIFNDGNTIAHLNDEPIYPFTSKTVGGNEGEIYVGQIKLKFTNPTPAPGSPENSVWITQKFYLKEQYDMP